MSYQMVGTFTSKNIHQVGSVRKCKGSKSNTRQRISYKKRKSKNWEHPQTMKKLTKQLRSRTKINYRKQASRDRPCPTTIRTVGYCVEHHDYTIRMYCQETDTFCTIDQCDEVIVPIFEEQEL